MKTNNIEIGLIQDHKNISISVFMTKIASRRKSGISYIFSLFISQL